MQTYSMSDNNGAGTEHELESDVPQIPESKLGGPSVLTGAPRPESLQHN